MREAARLAGVQVPAGCGGPAAGGPRHGVDARQAIRIVRECVEAPQLQERILRGRLDAAMRQAADVGHLRAATLDWDAFLRVLCEEHHAERVAGAAPRVEACRQALEGKLPDFLLFLQESFGGSPEEVFLELDAAGTGVVRREAFVRAIRERGYQGDASDVWSLLDGGGAGAVGLAEFARLDGAGAAHGAYVYVINIYIYIYI